MTRRVASARIVEFLRSFPLGSIAMLAALIPAVPAAHAQVVNPADLPAKPGPVDSTAFSGGHPRSWEMPEILVEGKGHRLKEEQRIGEYRQPRWTATRRFTTTRVYVIPKGKAEFDLDPNRNARGQH